MKTLVSMTLRILNMLVASEAELVLFSFGGGQDSSALAVLLRFEPFRRIFAGKNIVAVMSDTDNEHDWTYENVMKMRELFSDLDIPFYFITENKKRAREFGKNAVTGYHAASWTGTIAKQCRDLLSKFKESLIQAGTKSCTMGLKIDPIYKWLDEYINEKYFDSKFNIRSGGGCNKAALKEYFKFYGQIDVIIGFAYGEEVRSEKSLKLQAREWQAHLTAKAKKRKGSWNHVINRVFPLQELGLDRKKCVELIEAELGYEVMPSNCMLCPYQSPAELLWLFLNHPDQWEIWVAAEQRKIDREEHLHGKPVIDKKTGEMKINEKTGEPVLFKNNGVYNSRKLLPERLIEAKEKFGHLTSAELHQYKKFHGCQTNSF